MERKVKVIGPLSRGLPKTGQETSYRNGDDGYFEDGWWFNRDIANNRTRFKSKVIVPLEALTLDYATGLMWPYDGESVACNSGVVLNWAEAIDYALALNWGGFDDWRLPNLREILSICSQELSSPATYVYFTGTLGPPYYKYWSSTTYIDNTALAWNGNLAHGNAGTLVKTDDIYMRPVRRFGK